MSNKILDQLDTLQPKSGKVLSEYERQRFFGQLSNPLKLAKIKQVANSNWMVVPRNGVSSLSQSSNRQAVRKVMTLPVGIEDNITYMLNTSLLGGESYPILTTLLGTAVGIASFGACLLFSAGTTALSLATTSQRVLARRGDEIWIVEEIGKASKGKILNSTQKVMHISAFFLVDPYRVHTPNRGWLIHEERKEVIME